MSRSDNRAFLIVIAAGIALALLMVFLGLRVEDRLGTIETQVMERAPGAEPLEKLDASPEEVAMGQTVYVPVYSHVYHDGGKELFLEVTLSIRNTDSDESIVVDSVRYHDSAGALISNYIEKSAILGPLASVDFLVERRSRAGGVGAKFLIEWVAETPVQEPIIEAVMVGKDANRAIAFVRAGVPVASQSADD